MKSKGRQWARLSSHFLLETTTYGAGPMASPGLRVSPLWWQEKLADLWQSSFPGTPPETVVPGFLWSSLLSTGRQAELNWSPRLPKPPILLHLLCMLEVHGQDFQSKTSHYKAEQGRTEWMSVSAHYVPGTGPGALSSTHRAPLVDENTDSEHISSFPNPPTASRYWNWTRNPDLPINHLSITWTF